MVDYNTKRNRLYGVVSYQVVLWTQCMYGGTEAPYNHFTLREQLCWLYDGYYTDLYIGHSVGMVEQRHHAITSY